MWLPPYITMLRQSVPAEQRGFITSVFILFADGFGSLFTYLLDAGIRNRWLESLGPFDFTTDGSWEGVCIFTFNAISLLGTIPFVYYAGKEFDRRRKEARESLITKL